MNFINIQFLLLILSCLSLCSLSDGGSDYSNVNVDRYPVNGHGGSPEKPLPNEPVYDSNEPNDDNNNFEPDWKDTINKVVAIALYVQVGLLVCYILVSKACFIKIRPSQFGEEYPMKPYDQSERRYLSKEDPMASDDFDTDPEDVEMY